MFIPVDAAILVGTWVQSWREFCAPTGSEVQSLVDVQGRRYRNRWIWKILGRVYHQCWNTAVCIGQESTLHVAWLEDRMEYLGAILGHYLQLFGVSCLANTSVFRGSRPWEEKLKTNNAKELRLSAGIHCLEKWYRGGFQADPGRCLKVSAPPHQDWLNIVEMHIGLPHYWKELKLTSVWGVGAGRIVCFETKSKGRSPKPDRTGTNIWPVTLGLTKAECGPDVILHAFQQCAVPYSAWAVRVFSPPPEAAGSFCCLLEKWIFSLLLQDRYHAAYGKFVLQTRDCWLDWILSCELVKSSRSSSCSAEENLFRILTRCLLTTTIGQVNLLDSRSKTREVHFLQGSHDFLVCLKASEIGFQRLTELIGLFSSSQKHRTSLPQLL